MRVYAATNCVNYCEAAAPLLKDVLTSFENISIRNYL